jgi:streptogramin lyase
MALDPAGNMLVIATPEEGLWIVRPENDTVQFVLLAGKSETFGLLKHVKRDPHGGVYFFNESTIVHFDETSGFQSILAVGDLTLAQNTVNDIAADPFGSLYIATDTGIYICRDGTVFRHLTRFEGIGTSNIVETINVDAQNRVWFSTQDDVGYYLDVAMQDPRIVIERMTIAPAESPVPAELPSSGSSPVTGQMTSSQVPATAVTANPAPGPLSGIIDPILRMIDSITSRFGLSIVH